MTDALWARNVQGRLHAQYPRIPERDVQALLGVSLDVLEPVLPAGELERAVEEQVRTSLRALSAALPRQRTGSDS